MIAVREDIVLFGQEGATRIDEVNAGQMVVARDVLGTQVFFHCHRVIRTTLDRGVIGDDDTLLTADAAYAGDDAGAGRIVVVHAHRGELRDFQERRSGVQ